ncbi:MAG: aminotransferase class III-fold pyridoxal phosphate-dependent enzyme [Cyanobacteria bacterium SZAS LIN-3]|nr:aminotransferase class III-fold pyridoxal phosphate-dependent enzyme [Cyanobacteria bacterium SZAS LIN-3]
MAVSVVNDLRESDRAYHLHPFTDHADMHKSGTHVVHSGEGIYVVDETGKKLLDGLAGLWCVNVGYGCKEIIEAVTTQMTRLAFYPSFFNSTTEPAIMLSERLAQLAPARLNRTFFSNSGSEANETALKTIRAYYKLRGEEARHKIISRKFAYHGVTMASASLTGLANCHGAFNLPLPGYYHAPAPYPYFENSDMDEESYGKWCIEETERLILAEDPKTIAAIFAEPIQGAGGVIVPPPGYLQALRQLARKYNLLFVADEVITGFGRLGDWFASSLFELDPDIMTLAKGITSGYLPMGATMVSDEIAEVLIKGGNFAHGFTYSGHPTVAAAALANLDYISKHNLIEHVKNEVGPYFQQKLWALKDHAAVGNVRGYGLIGALELVPAGGRAAIVPNSYIGIPAANLCREEGVIVRGIRDAIAMSPPLVITRDEIDIMFSGIERALDRFLAG